GRLAPRTLQPVGKPIHVGGEPTWLAPAGRYLFVGDAAGGIATRGAGRGAGGGRAGLPRRTRRRRRLGRRLRVADADPDQLLRGCTSAERRRALDGRRRLSRCR